MAIEMPKEYTTVSITKELNNTIKLIVNTSSRFTSVSEFVKEAIREKIKQAIEIDQNLKKIIP